MVDVYIWISFCPDFFIFLYSLVVDLRCSIDCS